MGSVRRRGHTSTSLRQQLSGAAVSPRGHDPRPSSRCPQVGPRCPGKFSEYRARKTDFLDYVHLHPLRRARPFALTTCAPSVPHGSVGSMRASGARSACTSLIFVRFASPPGTARAALRALLRPARPPRGSTRGPLGAGGPSAARQLTTGAGCTTRSRRSCAGSCPSFACRRNRL
jgi:hypothetical protein